VFGHALNPDHLKAGVAEWLRDWEVVEVRARADLVNDGAGLVPAQWAVDWDVDHHLPIWDGQFPPTSVPPQSTETERFMLRRVCDGWQLATQL
jgi:hypothetical protein